MIRSGFEIEVEVIFLNYHCGRSMNVSNGHSIFLFGRWQVLVSFPEYVFKPPKNIAQIYPAECRLPQLVCLLSLPMSIVQRTKSRTHDMQYLVQPHKADVMFLLLTEIVIFILF